MRRLVAVVVPAATLSLLLMLASSPALAAESIRLHIAKTEASAGDTVRFSIAGTEPGDNWKVTIGSDSRVAADQAAVETVASGTDSSGGGVSGDFRMPDLGGSSRTVYVEAQVGNRFSTERIRYVAGSSPGGGGGGGTTQPTETFGGSQSPGAQAPAAPGRGTTGGGNRQRRPTGERRRSTGDTGRQRARQRAGGGTPRRTAPVSGSPRTRTRSVTPRLTSAVRANRGDRSRSRRAAPSRGRGQAPAPPTLASIPPGASSLRALEPRVVDTKRAAASGGGGGFPPRWLLLAVALSMLVGLSGTAVRRVRRGRTELPDLAPSPAAAAALNRPLVTEPGRPGEAPTQPLTSTRQEADVAQGLVQDVLMRAQEHGVNGWVRKRPDGTLEAVFEGDPAAVDRLVKFCEKPPRGTSVEKVEKFEEQPEGLTGFSVR